MIIEAGETLKRITILALNMAFVIMFAVSDVRTSASSTVAEEYNPVIDPVDFVAVVDNQYFPLMPGTTFIYKGKTEDGNERIEVNVTNQTKEVLGVTCIVVRDRVWVDDELAEETFDWYAQDKDGNVWYFGEDSKEYENGVVVSTEGSWEAGVDGAKPGIIMKANPQVGDSYRQEYYKGVAEDMAEVLSLNESVSVPYGSFENCLKTKEWTPLVSGVVEHKYYAPGIGFVLEVMVEGGSDRIELIEVTCRIKVKPGWNLISFPVNKCFYHVDQPIDQPACVEKVNVSTLGFSSMADWFSSVLTPNSAWQMVIGVNGAMDSSLPSIFHTLEYMSPCFGYWVKIKDGINSAVLSLDGLLFDPECPIPLQEGWNLVGCPLGVGYYDTDSPPSGKHVPEGTTWVKVGPPVTAYIFNSIAEKYDMVIGEDGVYDPDLPLEFSSLHYIASGYGYWIKMKEAASLILP